MEELINQRWLKYKAFDLERPVTCKKSCWESRIFPKNDNFHTQLPQSVIYWNFSYCICKVKTLEISEELKK